MDFAHPIEAVIPGAPGRLLAALARVDAELPVSRLATIAGVGRTRASALISEFAELGIVSRRQIGPTTLVRLDRDNAAGSLVGQLGNIHFSVIEQLRHLARNMDPQPVTLLLYGSFARGTAKAASDIDILAIRPADADSELWSDSLTEFSEQVRKVTGNSAQILDYDTEEFLGRYVTCEGAAGAEFWRSVTRDAVVLTGINPGEITGEGHDSRQQPPRSE